MLIGSYVTDPAELNLEAERDVHAITGLLKLYFRELAEPVFPEVLYHDFIVAASTYSIAVFLFTLNFSVSSPFFFILPYQCTLLSLFATSSKKVLMRNTVHFAFSGACRKPGPQ